MSENEEKRVKLTIWMRESLHDRLVAESMEKDISKAKIARTAIEEYLERLGK